jgi:WD40 repeat protein
VYEFDLKRRQRLPGLFGSHGAVPASGFSADGRYLISGRQDGSFDIYDTTADEQSLTPLELKAPGVFYAPVVAAAFSPVPGSYQFLIARGKSLELYELDTTSNDARLLQVLATPEDGPTLLATAGFSHDGRWIAAAGEDHVVRLFDTQSRDKAQSVIAIDANAFAEGVKPMQHSGRVTSVAVADVEAPNGSLVIASGSEDQTAIVWVVDPASRRVVSAVPLKGHTRAVTSVAFAPGQFDRLLTGSNDRTARLWDWDGGGIDDWKNAGELANLDPPAGETLILSGVHTEGVTVVGFSPDGRTILTAAQDGRAVLWPSQPAPTVEPSDAAPTNEEGAPPKAEEQQD